MDTQQTRRRIPKIQFRVLIIGRANAGKTSILQRVCDTTESPVVYRRNRRGIREEVTLDPSMERGEHTIDDELVFSNHKGYVFHDSRGIESGSTEELRILQEFIQRKCGEKRLRDRLHAIWYCVPMDNQRPQLDLKFFKDICPDRNVPVIAVFTKYDQFKLNVEMHLMDYGNPFCNTTSDEAERQFKERYLNSLGGDVICVRLEKMHRQHSHCSDLLYKTATALNDNVFVLMLLAVQRSNVELSVKVALNHVYDSHARLKVQDPEGIVKGCLQPFPYIWLWDFLSFDLSFSDFLDFLDSNNLLNDDDLKPMVAQILSLPTIQNLTAKPSHPHLVLAVILILKHATLLRSDLSAESAIAHVELAYQEAKIDSKIQEHLIASSQKHSVELFASFIMVTDIVSSQSLVQTLQSLVNTHVPQKGHWFKWF